MYNMNHNKNKKTSRIFVAFIGKKKNYNNFLGEIQQLKAWISKLLTVIIIR